MREDERKDGRYSLLEREGHTHSLLLLRDSVIYRDETWRPSLRSDMTDWSLTNGKD
jgi:hypothetical protein